MTSSITKQQLTIAADAFYYSCASSIAIVIAFLAGIMTKSIVGPTDIGLWALLNVLLTYMGLSEMGAISAANKEIPYELAKCNSSNAERLKGTMLSFVTLTAVIGMVGVLFYAVFSVSSLSRKAFVGLILIALSFPLFQLQFAHTSIYWMNRQSGITGTMTMLEAISNAVFGITLTWSLGIYGLYITFITTLIMKVSFLSSRARRDPHLALSVSWSNAALARLVSSGLPLQLSNIMNILRNSVPFLFLGHYLNNAYVGYYALAINVQNLVLQTPYAIWIIMFPRFQEQYAVSNNDNATLMGLAMGPLRALSLLILPVLISGAYVFGPLVIRHITPQFTPTISILKVLLAGTYFLSLETVVGQILITTNRLWLRVITGVVSVVMLLACLMVIRARSDAFLGIAIAVGFSNAVSFFIVFFVSWAVVAGNRDTARWPLRVLGICFYMMVVLVMGEHVIPSSESSLLVDAFWSGVKYCVSLIGLSPLLIIAARRLSLLKTLRSLLASRGLGVKYEA